MFPDVMQDETWEEAVHNENALEIAVVLHFAIPDLSRSSGVRWKDTWDRLCLGAWR